MRAGGRVIVIEWLLGESVAVGLSRSRFGSAAPDECRAQTRESLVSITSPKRDGHAISFFAPLPVVAWQWESPIRFGSFARYSDAATAIFCYLVFGLEYPFPVPRHFHLLGAMVPSNLPAAQDSNDELSRWLDSHPSVIYVGLGTLVRLSHVQIKALITAFKCLEPNHHILWKLPDSRQALLPRGELLPTNLRIERWIPSQLGVLAHPNVRVFILLLMAAVMVSMRELFWEASSGDALLARLLRFCRARH
jgi:UDP-glucoronosyl and UDP-glucosyl transferase